MSNCTLSEVHVQGMYEQTITHTLNVHIANQNNIDVHLGTYAYIIFTMYTQLFPNNNNNDNNNNNNTHIYAAHHIHSGRVLKGLTTDRATC